MPRSRRIRNPEIEYPAPAPERSAEVAVEAQEVTDAEREAARVAEVMAEFKDAQ